MPKFPGGEKALFDYLGKTIKYPEKARNNNVSGTVYITFVVGLEGSIAEVKLLRGIGKECDEEALRVIKMMPAWQPGTQNGVPVRVQYNLPIRFTLRGNEKEEKAELKKVVMPLYEKREYRECLDKLEAYINKNTSDFDVLYLAANCAYNLDFSQKACLYYSQASELKKLGKDDQKRFEKACKKAK